MTKFSKDYETIDNLLQEASSLARQSGLTYSEEFIDVARDVAEKETTMKGFGRNFTHDLLSNGGRLS